MTGPVPAYTVVDMTPQCEIRSEELYEYQLLERIEGALDLIANFSAEIWRQPDEFEMSPKKGSDLRFRWCATSPTTGTATLKNAEKTLSLSLLASGLDEASDGLTLQAFQNHAVCELRDTQYEPAFDLMNLRARPVIVTVGLAIPNQNQDQAIFAMADRCFAAAYFRRLGLA